MGTFDQRWQIMLIGGVAPAAVVVGLDSAENELAYRLLLQEGAIKLVDDLFFQRRKKVLYACVVEAAMCPSHALLDGTKFRNRRPRFPAGVLDAVVGVQDQTLLVTITQNRVMQGVAAQVGTHMLLR